MRPRRTLSTGQKVVLAVWVAVVAFTVAAVVLRSSHLLNAIPMLAIALAIAALAVLLLLAYRAFRRTTELPRIEPSFETSILAFPPESRLEPRAGRRG